MSQLKLTADGGGGTVSLKGPSTTTGNAAIELTVPGTGSSTLATTATAGKILQVIYVQKTDTFSSSSSSWVDITGLTANITMTSSSNKVLVTCHISGLNDATTGSGLGIDRNGSFVGLPQSGYGNRQNIMGSEFYESRSDSFRVQSFTFLDTPSSGTHTYKVRAHPKSQALYINRSVADSDSSDFSRGTSDMTLMEVAA
tara:strand:- start:32 stop:628 length:597 start_codon:yes stop_codon:yes gene_type:complete